MSLRSSFQSPIGASTLLERAGIINCLAFAPALLAIVFSQAQSVRMPLFPKNTPVLLIRDSGSRWREALQRIDARMDDFAMMDGAESDMDVEQGSGLSESQTSLGGRSWETWAGGQEETRTRQRMVAGIPRRQVVKQAAAGRLSTRRGGAPTRGLTGAARVLARPCTRAS
jgi:hypothetical protein